MVLGKSPSLQLQSAATANDYEEGDIPVYAVRWPSIPRTDASRRDRCIQESKGFLGLRRRRFEPRHLQGHMFEGDASTELPLATSARAQSFQR